MMFETAPGQGLQLIGRLSLCLYQECRRDVCLILSEVYAQVVRKLSIQACESRKPCVMPDSQTAMFLPTLARSVLGLCNASATASPPCAAEGRTGVESSDVETSMRCGPWEPNLIYRSPTQNPEVFKGED